MYGDFHVKDKTVVIFNIGIAIPGKTVFLIETAPSCLLYLCAKGCLLWVVVTKSWWRHQMEAFSALLALCVGNSPATGEFPYLTKASDAGF